MVRKHALLPGSLLALLATALASESASVIVLLGKPYPQYQQVSLAFAQEWKKATGTEPIIVSFPGDDITVARLAPRQPRTIVCLGEAPTAWAVRQPESFNLGFSMVVKPERLRALREASKHKDRNLMGISIEVPIEDQLRVVLQIMPSWRRIGVITLDPALKETVREMQAVCEKRGLQLYAIELTATSELPEKLDKLLGRIDLLWSLPDSNVLQPQLAQHIIGQCAARRVALLGLSSTFVKAGATLSIERDYQEIGRLLAQHYLKQVEQAETSNWVVQAPQGITLSVNDRSLETLGVGMQEAGPLVRIVKY